MRRLVIAAAVALVAAPAARGQLRYQTVSFDELLAAHVKARIGIDRLPSINVGQAIAEPAVYVTATRSRVLVYGETLASLSNGRVAAEDVEPCASGATCIPRLRDAIVDARARLGRRLETRPPVLLLADAALPYETLLLVARSAAEAGAPRSLRVVARRGPELIGLPVWVAPGRTLVLSEVSSPRLIAVELRGDGKRVVRSAGDAPVLAANDADLLSHLGQLQLSSGRTTYFLAGGPDARVGDVVAAAALVRDIFPNVVLHEGGRLDVIVR